MGFRSGKEELHWIEGKERILSRIWRQGERVPRFLNFRRKPGAKMLNCQKE